MRLYPRQTQLHTPNVAWHHPGRFCKLLPLCLEIDSNGLPNNCAKRFQTRVWLVLTSANTSAGTLPVKSENSSEMTQRKKNKSKPLQSVIWICLDIQTSYRVKWFIKFLRCFYRATLVFNLQNKSMQHGGKSLFTQETKKKPPFLHTPRNTSLIWILLQKVSSV